MTDRLKKYLNENHRCIEIHDREFKGLSLLDRQLKTKEIFLAGENHGVKGNTQLRMEFLKYFKEKTNFKYYLCELPYSMTATLNRYLKTGDEGILEDVYRALKGTDAWNKDDYNHWRELYRFNGKFKEDEKILALGIDIEHQPKNAFKYMEYILNKRKSPEKIKNYITEIYRKEEISYEQLKIFYRKTKEELVNNEKTYKDLLGEDYLSIKLVNDNLSNMVDVYTGNNFAGIRDEKMGENFSRVYKTLSKGKYYGQMGLSHVFQETFPYVNWFGSFLNRQGSEFRNKVLSIAYAYKDCKYLYPTKRKNYIGSLNTLDPYLEEFEYFTNNPFTMFDLDGDKSPFREKLIWPLEHKNPVKGVTTDYFQYLILIKSSGPMEAFPID